MTRRIDEIHEVGARRVLEDDGHSSGRDGDAFLFLEGFRVQRSSHSNVLGSQEASLGKE